MHKESLTVTNFKGSEFLKEIRFGFTCKLFKRLTITQTFDLLRITDSLNERNVDVYLYSWN